MTWFRVDDGLAFHAKTLLAGNAAMGMWVRAGAWCSQHLTDGHVPAHVAVTLGTAEEAARLVTCGLWLEDEDGFRFHDWHQSNPRSEDVERKREAARERMRSVREKFAGSSREQSENVRENFAGSSPNPDPTRPDPKTPTVSTARKRATTPTPDVFPISEAMEAWAREKHPLVTDLQDQTERFLDYHRGKGSRQADWTATWRTWIRNAAKYERERPALRAVPADRYGSWDV